MALINEHNPDVVCGTESHLDHSFYTPEIFPDEYNVFRKDRTMGGGGVFLCIKKNLQCLEESTLDVEAELIWVKLTPLKSTPYFLCAFYCPPLTDLHRIQQLRVPLNKLMDQSRTLPNILLMRAFNF